MFIKCKFNKSKKITNNSKTLKTPSNKMCKKINLISYIIIYIISMVKNFVKFS